MHEPNDTRSDTDAAPPMSEPGEKRPTLPPEEPKTMLPSRTPSDFKEVAANEVIAGQRHLQASLDQLLGPGGRLEQQTAAIASVVDAAAARQMSSYDMLRADMLRRYELLNARDKDLASELASLASRVVTIERAQRDVRASVLSLIDALEAVGGTAKGELVGRKVLLVDDNDLILKSLSRVLSSHGATVLTASTLPAVQSLVEKLDPDCVVVDVRLAGDEDGSVVIEWLLKYGFGRSRLLLMTGDQGAGVAEANRLQVALIEKPIAADKLVRVVREASVRPS